MAPNPMGSSRLGSIFLDDGKVNEQGTDAHMTTICHVSAPKFEKSAANVFQKFILFFCLLLF